MELSELNKQVRAFHNRKERCIITKVSAFEKQEKKETEFKEKALSVIKKLIHCTSQTNKGYYKNTLVEQSTAGEHLFHLNSFKAYEVKRRKKKRRADKLNCDIGNGITRKQGKRKKEKEKVYIELSPIDEFDTDNSINDRMDMEERDQTDNNLNNNLTTNNTQAFSIRPLPIHQQEPEKEKEKEKEKEEIEREKGRFDNFDYCAVEREADRIRKQLKLFRAYQLDRLAKAFASANYALKYNTNKKDVLKAIVGSSASPPEIYKFFNQSDFKPNHHIPSSTFNFRTTLPQIYNQKT